MMDNNDPLAPNMVRAATREIRAWELRAQHKTYKQIGEEIAKEEGREKPLTPQAVSYMLERAVAKFGGAAREKVETTLSVRLEQLDHLANAYHAKALAGDEKAGKLYLDTLERMDRVVGLDKREEAPQQVAIQVNLSGLSEERLAELSAARRQIAAIQRRTTITEEPVSEREAVEAED